MTFLKFLAVSLLLSTPALCQTSLPLKQQGSLYFVQIEINDKMQSLLLDTGSDISIVDPSVIPNFTHEGLSGAGFGGAISFIGYGSANIKTGKGYKYMQVRVQDFSKIQKAYGFKFDGVLGLDFISKFSCFSVDFKAKTISFCE